MVVLALTGIGACASERPRVAPAAAGEKAPDVVSGHLRTGYRGRFAGHEDDHDLTQTLLLDVHDPEQRWDASLLARATLDLDGRDFAEDQDFFSLADTYDQRLEAQLYHAYVDLALATWELVRIGRQPLYEAPFPLVFDGLRAEKRVAGPADLLVGAFAGLGEHSYESSPEGDAVVGAFGAASAWKGSELRVDWMRLEDRRLGERHGDDLVAVTASQELAREESISRLEGRLTALDGNGRDVRLTASRVDSRHDLSLQGTYLELLQTQRDLAAPLDPFSDSLFELEPYRQFTLSAAKNWEEWALSAGTDLRRVANASDEGTYNRDFGRLWATVGLPEWERFRLALTGERWDATGSDYATWGLDLERPLPADLELSLGSHFALFDYDLLAGEERDRVRTYSLDLRWKRGTTQRWALRYEFEHNDFDDFHRIRLDTTWLF